MNGSYTNPSGGISLTPEQLILANTIAADALAHEGFVPTCGQSLVLIINSGDRIRYQNTFILVPIPETPFYGDETAWGNGMPFLGGSWAMYFNYCLL
jgi:hypothetical protein